MELTVVLNVLNWSLNEPNSLYLIIIISYIALPFSVHSKKEEGKSIIVAYILYIRTVHSSLWPFHLTIFLFTKSSGRRMLNRESVIEMEGQTSLKYNRFMTFILASVYNCVDQFIWKDKLNLSPFNYRSSIENGVRKELCIV